MDLIEGVSNEVLIAFSVTLLLMMISIFVFLFSERRTRIQSASVIHETEANNAFESESDSVRDSGPRNDVNHSSPMEDVSTETTEPLPSEENLRRRAGCDREESQGEPMVVKVKHNENIRSFNVTTNVTVIQLKRLAFSHEIYAGKRVRFVYGGQLLRNDNDPLTSYGVQDNTVVHCVITDPVESQENVQEQEADLDLSRLFIPLLTVGLIMSWYGLINYKHIFTGSSIAILMFLTSLYFIMVYITVVQ